MFNLELTKEELHVLINLLTLQKTDIRNKTSRYAVQKMSRAEIASQATRYTNIDSIHKKALKFIESEMFTAGE